MAKMTRTTPSGVAIPEEEYQSIRKDAIKDTLRNVFAGIGVLAAAVFIRGYFDSRTADDSPKE